MGAPAKMAEWADAFYWALQTKVLEIVKLIISPSTEFCFFKQYGTHKPNNWSMSNQRERKRGPERAGRKLNPDASNRIIQIGIQANLAKILSKGHFFGKKALATQKFNMVAIFSRWPLFLSNAHYVNRSNSDVGITFCENTLLIIFFWKMVLIPQKFKMATIFQDGHHFSWIFRWWCYHQIWYKYSSRNILMEKGVWELSLIHA